MKYRDLAKQLAHKRMTADELTPQVGVDLIGKPFPAKKFEKFKDTYLQLTDGLCKKWKLE